MERLLGCDNCGTEFDLPKWGPDGSYRHRGAHWGQTAQLEAEAVQAGWKILDVPGTANTLPHKKHFCPACAAKIGELR